MELKIIDDTVDEPAEPFCYELVRVLANNEIRKIYYYCFKNIYINQKNNPVLKNLLISCQNEMSVRNIKY